MKTSLRFAAVTAVLAFAIWGGPARTSHAWDFYCNSAYPNPCEPGTWATCRDGERIRNCECLQWPSGGGRWLCYW